MTPTPDLLEAREKLHALATLESERGYLRFLSYAVVDAQPNKKPFHLIAEPWQWDRAYRVAGAIDHLCGIRETYTGPLAFWNGYHKGSDKTHDNAREIAYLLGWSRRRLNLYVGAGSEDQAALITTAMKGMLLDNPWIAERVHVTDLTASGASGSELTILSMNAYTGQGIFPDYFVAEEVTHWMYDDGKKFWEFILESVNKRPQCVLKVATNAGMKGTWQWEERKRIGGDPSAPPDSPESRGSKFWSFYEAPVGNPLPSWMNQDKIDDDSQGLSPGERDRLYKNRWIDPGEEYGYLTLEEAMRCRDYTLEERTHGDRDTDYFIVIDYGGVIDRTALAVMHVTPGTNHAIIDRLDCWQGDHHNRVPILSNSPDYSDRSVESWVQTVRETFRVSTIVVDPHQLESLAIRYERQGLRVMRFQYRTGKANHRMAQILKTCVQNRQITWSPYAGKLPSTIVIDGRVKTVEDDTLEKELSMLVTKNTVYGYRFDHESGRFDDRSVCVAMGLIHLFPEALPAGPLGPKTVDDERKITAPGVLSTHRSTSEEDSAAIGRWKVMGLSGGGSKWDRGDISD